VVRLDASSTAVSADRPRERRRVLERVDLVHVLHAERTFLCVVYQRQVERRAPRLRLRRLTSVAMIARARCWRIGTAGSDTGLCSVDANDPCTPDPCVPPPPECIDDPSKSPCGPPSPGSHDINCLCA
jgi:hypothetical protein